MNIRMADHPSMHTAADFDMSEYSQRFEVKIKKQGIPFIPYDHDVFYIEKEYNKAVNDEILRYYDVLMNLDSDHHLIYFPKVNEIATQEWLPYLYPAYDSIGSPHEIRPFDWRALRQSMLDNCEDPSQLTGGFLRYQGREDDVWCYFWYFRFIDPARRGVCRQADDYFASARPIVPLYNIDHFPGGFRDANEVYWHLYERNNPDFADGEFPEEYKHIALEIRSRLDRLRQAGVSEYAIRKMLGGAPIKLSRLLVTTDYRIILPDYNGLEIAMSTLSKVVYFFYLKHPEGVMFKQLVDYRAEMTAIYKTISNRESPDDMERSIQLMTDSTNNSINEKCSRIQTAFLSNFDMLIAKNYIITGERATPKKIILDRSLVSYAEGCQL
jgi:hypothetical protein